VGRESEYKDTEVDLGKNSRNLGQDRGGRNKEKLKKNFKKYLEVRDEYEVGKDQGRE
jgi:hypothetical protein